MNIHKFHTEVPHLLVLNAFMIKGITTIYCAAFFSYANVHIASGYQRWTGGPLPSVSCGYFPSYSLLSSLYIFSSNNVIYYGSLIHLHTSSKRYFISN